MNSILKVAIMYLSMGMAALSFAVLLAFSH